MTYTTVYRDYKAANLDEAAGLMLRDPDVFKQTRPPSGDRSAQGGANEYAVDSWEWDGSESRLRVWFR